MNVKELKAFLQLFPDDMEVVVEKHSDYNIILPTESGIVKGVFQTCWVMQSNQTMSEENKQKEKAYLLLAGD